MLSHCEGRPTRRVRRRQRSLETRRSRDPGPLAERRTGANGGVSVRGRAAWPRTGRSARPLAQCGEEGCAAARLTLAHARPWTPSARGSLVATRRARRSVAACRAGAQRHEWEHWRGVRRKARARASRTKGGRPASIRKDDVRLIRLQGQVVARRRTGDEEDERCGRWLGSHLGTRRAGGCSRLQPLRGLERRGRGRRPFRTGDGAQFVAKAGAR